MNNKSDYKIWRKDKPHLLTMQHATGISPSHDSAMHLLQVYGWLFLLGLNEPPPSNSYHHLKTWWHTMIEEGTQGRNQKNQRTSTKNLSTQLETFGRKMCHRVFDNKAIPPSLLPSAIKTDVQQWRIAWNNIAEINPYNLGLLYYRWLAA
jgi:hypothetical protein